MAVIEIQTIEEDTVIDDFLKARAEEWENGIYVNPDEVDRNVERSLMKKAEIMSWLMNDFDPTSEITEADDNE